jgi:DNA adenine methylase
VGVLNGHAEWLEKQILHFDLTLENVVAVLKEEPDDLPARAFQTVIRNRVQRCGILAEGAGLIRTGENGRGLRSRWYPETLARRIRDTTWDALRVRGIGFSPRRTVEARSNLFTRGTLSTCAPRKQFPISQ